MARHPVRRWRTGDSALLAGEPVTIAGLIDHGGPGPLDELLVELAGGDERTVHRNELTARLDVIEGDRCTREVYLAGGRLKQSESLAVTAHSPDGFGWGDDDLGAAQLALAVLLRAADRDTALAQYEAFTREVIATLPQGDFSLRLACVHEWLVARTDS